MNHAGFYKRFIKDFSKVSKPLSTLLMEGVPFEFDDVDMNGFESLKKKNNLIAAPDWEIPFELMCDVRDYAVSAILGQRKNKVFHAIYYTSGTLNDAQLNYATIEKELLAIVFAFDKFVAYLIGNKVTVFTNHYAIKYLMTKKDAKSRFIRWC